MTTDVGFNLLDEPWIVTLDPAGRERELSILDVFDHAADLVTIGGEVPTQSFAITRMLLAFLHRALDGPRDQDAWVQLWAADGLPMDRIRTYADHVRDRFDLFDPAVPFMQVADLRTAKDEVSGLEKIVADVPNGQPYFTTRSASSLTVIPPSEAARWLVHTHAFDPSGIKSGAVGDPVVRNGKGYPIGTGWSGQLGGVLAEGANLRETLLLNLIAYDANTYVTIGGHDDLPPWERPPDGPASSDGRTAHGAVTLYTWQTRRIRLHGDRNGVLGVVLANGDKIQPQNRHQLEPHTAWRYSAPQSKKHNQDTYMPRAHDVRRSVWDGLAALLPSVHGQRSPRSDSPTPIHPPGVLQWIGDLVADGHLDEDVVVRTRTIGATYGTQSATFDEILDDQIPLAVVLLRKDRPDLGRAVEGAAEDADAAAFEVWKLAENLAQAAGAAPKSGAGDRAREQVYAALEQPYRQWLVGLDRRSDPSDARSAWQGAVHDGVRPTVDALLRAAPPAAWSGRTVGNRLMNVGKAEAVFRAGLRRALPNAFPNEEPTTEVA